MYSWKKVAEGIRVREHNKRFHGIGPDKYYAIYFRQNGKQIEQGLGWASQGVTLDQARKTLAELRRNYLHGEGPTTLSEKRKLKQEAEEEAERHRELEEKENISFRTFFEATYLPSQTGHKPKTTWEKEKAHAKNWIFPVVGQVPIKKITSFQVEKIKKGLLDAGRAPRTIQHVLATFRQVWNCARRAGIVSGDSPSRSVKIPRFDNMRLRFLTDGEIDELLEALQRECDVTYCQAVLSLDCGLRFGEVAKLTWADVDLARETLLLRDTKSSRNRVVYMTSRIKKILRAMTKGRPDELVFPGPENKPLREVSRVFERVVKELDFNRDIDDDRLKVVFHSLRHTHASRLLESGADVYYVKTLLGHRNIQTTERYLHVRSENLREAVKRMEQKSNVISLEETHHGTKAR